MSVHTIFSKYSTGFLLLFALSAFSSQAQQLQLKSVSRLKYLNNFVIPYDTLFQQTVVGGLSGIDFDPIANTYYLICDDRSSKNPARFYTAKIAVSATGIDRVVLTGVDTLRQQNGNFYPHEATKGSKTSDPEAIRYNPLNQTLIWTSEGERILNDTDTILINPAINVISKDGRYRDTIPLPDNLRMEAVEHGPRRNYTLEGLTFADNFKSLFVSLEEPLYQDGARPDLTPNKPFVRIYKFDMASKKNTAQYAYPLDAVPLPPLKPDGAIDNGIPDLLNIGKDRFLITERAFSTGRGKANIRLYLTELGHAENIIGIKSLLATPAVRPLKKKLLFNMDTIGIYIDNVEGATIGPLLPNGHQTLIFVTDNNFNKNELSQFLIFEVIP